VAREHESVLVAAVGKGAPHIAFGEPGERDESRGGRVREPGTVEERYAAVLTFEPGPRDEIGDVLVPGRILA
jgi:hypothetical protein